MPFNKPYIRRLINQPSFWLLSFVCIFIFRWFFRLTRATLWAEDGTFFLHDALTYGSKSLLISYEGYFHTVPRITALVASYFPVIIMPHIIVICCFCITVYVLCTILKSEYEWVIPSVSLRGVLLVLLALGPGTSEAYGNIANIHSVLYLYVALIGLRKLSYQFSIAELIFVLLSIASEGAMITLLPLFIFRFYFQLKTKQPLRLKFQELFIVFMIMVFAIINYTMRISKTSTHIDLIPFEVFIKTSLAEFLSYPWMGDMSYTTFTDVWFLPGICLLVISFFILKGYWSFKAEIIIPVVFFAGFLLYPALISMARMGSGDLFLHASWWLFMRYGFPAAIAGYIFWIWILSFLEKIKPQVTSYLCVLLIMIAGTICARKYLFIQPTQKNVWIKNVGKIEDVRQNFATKKIVLPIQPDNWDITIGLGNKADSVLLK